MTQRIEGSNTYTFAYDAENRLMTGAKNGVTLASYTYDGDGKRVKVVEGGLTTYYIGDYYEWREGSTTTAVKYYYAAGQRIAMRQPTTLTWLLGDHLGSATITATENGTLASEQKYTAWGQTRSGSVGTDRQYTGQINEPQLGLYFYNARFYDPYLARFIQADTIIPQPGNPMAWDRYGYVNNSPVNFTDPSGHKACENFDESGHCTDPIGVGYVLLHEFGWITQGNWHDNELSEILKSGRDIRNYVNEIVPGKGEAWMNKFMGGVTFKHGSLFGFSFVTGSTVHLVDSLKNRWITHELAHVYDNRSAQDMGNNGEALWFGGGNADLMHQWLGGGVPQGLRFMNGTSNMPDKYQFKPSDGYGNHSTADYFAEVFALAINPDPNYILPENFSWGPLLILESFIKAEGSTIN
jgi:RHS repeat-associated protein